MKLGGQRNYANTWLIGDTLWDLKFVRRISEDSLGITDPSTNTFYVKQKQSREQIFSTFLHEIIHTLEDEYEFNIDHRLVYKLEESMVKFVLDNLPALTRIFIE